MKYLKLSLVILASIIFIPELFAFCGFYVAKADADLFNEKSEVIVARDGNQTTITMNNDFKGNVKDFAMVVPVPEVLQKKNIRVAKREIFDKLDTYSSPRLVEYFDDNPCEQAKPSIAQRWQKSMTESAVTTKSKDKAKKEYGVSIEATYTVGEYDILILSAKESDGLKRWLTDNEYKIPSQAEEVLDPYIKNNMKFFVVKVNLEESQKSGFDYLRPLQITFNSNKFMLPIRLGMANAKGDQDMVVYAFSRKGRIETSNYRTVKIPTDRDIPTFLKPQFGEFYVDAFEKAWAKEDGKAVMLEYSWDLSSSNFVKCDPCNTEPPKYEELAEAGVKWVQPQQFRGGSDYQGDIHFTRLHVRYNRQDYPQDLRFQETPNKERFQGRYIMRHAATGDLRCAKGQEYIEGLVERRGNELKELAALTGWDTKDYEYYLDNYIQKIPRGKRGKVNKQKGLIGDQLAWNLAPVSDNGDSYIGSGDGAESEGMPFSTFLLLTAIAVGGVITFAGFKALRG